MRLAIAEMMRAFAEPSLHVIVVVWSDLCSQRCACYENYTEMSFVMSRALRITDFVPTTGVKLCWSLFRPSTSGLTRYARCGVSETTLSWWPGSICARSAVLFTTTYLKCRVRYLTLSKSQILIQRPLWNCAGVYLGPLRNAGHDKRGAMCQKRQTKEGLVRFVLAAR